MLSIQLHTISCRKSRQLQTVRPVANFKTGINCQYNFFLLQVSDVVMEVSDGVRKVSDYGRKVLDGDRMVSG